MDGVGGIAVATPGGGPGVFRGAWRGWRSVRAEEKPPNVRPLREAA